MLTALEFIKTKFRLCNSMYECKDCPLYEKHSGCSIMCGKYIGEQPEEAIAIVEQWAKEHPIKTLASDFFEKYPKAPRNGEIDDIPDLCVTDIGIKPHVHKCMGDPYECEQCWNRPLEEVNK